MKNTIRATHKNGNKTASAQPKKPSIHGQNAATIGHIKAGVKRPADNGLPRTAFEKELLIAGCIGIAIGLKNNEERALALICRNQGEFVSRFCVASIKLAMAASYNAILLKARDSKDADEKQDAAETIDALDELGITFSPPSDLRRIDARTKLENAVTETKALLQLMFNVIEHDAANDFATNNGHLAAGLMGLMKSAQEKLGNAWEAV